MDQNHIHQIYYIEYPLAFRFGSYLALFRPMTISHLVIRLYDFSDLHLQTYQRLSKTRDLIRELIFYGIDSSEGAKAIAHINQKHVGLTTDNDAFRYVLCCFFLEPFRWNDSFDRKKIQPKQKQQIIDFWCDIGMRMGISELFSNETEWQKFQNEYEAKHMAYSKEGQHLAKLSLLETPKIVFSPGVRKLVRQTLLATMDEKVKRTLQIESSIIPPGLVIKILPILSKLAKQKKVA